MASAFKGRIEKFVNNLQGEFLRNKTSRERDDIAIVVLTAEMCYFGVPTESTPHVRILVDSHLDPVATATDYNADLNSPLLMARPT